MSASEEINRLCDEMAALVMGRAEKVSVGKSYMATLADLLMTGEGLVDPNESSSRPHNGHPPGENNDEDPSRVKIPLAEDQESEVSAPPINGDLDLDDAENNPDDDEEYSGDQDPEFDEETVVRWLDSLSGAIEHRLEAPDQTIFPHLKTNQGKQPYRHQIRAASQIVAVAKTSFKGFILADPPGLGKTLSSLLAVDASTDEASGPTVVVTTRSCCLQWASEIKEWFDTKAIPVLVLTGTHPLSPLYLFRYRIIVTSYSRVAAEVSRVAKFFKVMDDYQAGTPGVEAPNRPMLTLLSGVFEQNEHFKVGRYVIFDEAHLLKNINGRTYSACHALRSHFDACVMLTGTPLDNIWIDCYALLSLLHGHHITSQVRMRLAFTDYNGTIPEQRPFLIPQGRFRTRLLQLLDAVMLRRPQLGADHPLLGVTTRVINFHLSDADLMKSNTSFMLYKRSCGMNQGRGRLSTTRDMSGWSHLIGAQQYAFHPKLPKMMALERAAALARLHGGGANADNAGTASQEARRIADQWLEDLGKGENWRSARMTTISDVVRRHLEWRPSDVFIIMDESVYALDVVELAIRKMRNPLPYARYDGRLDSTTRHRTLLEFASGDGPRALLTTRESGGLGLNLQCANVLIICCPWWKRAQIEQAIARIWRNGQTKHCYVYFIRAAGCQVEIHKLAVENRKNDLNTLIMRALERGDDDPAPPPREIN